MRAVGAAKHSTFAALTGRIRPTPDTAESAGSVLCLRRRDLGQQRNEEKPASSTENHGRTRPPAQDATRPLKMALEGILPHIDVGSGTPVVLLHGFGLDARMWSAQIDGLRRCHRVLAPDLPGFGPQGVEAGVVRPAEAVFQLFTTKGLAPVHLVGSSLGGAVAVDLLLAHPDVVRTLVLVDALLLGERPGIDAWATCMERAKRGDTDGAREAWFSAALFDGLRSREETRERTREMIGAYRCGHWRGGLETEWLRPDPRPLLSGIRCPTLVLVGAEDSLSFKAMARVYAEAVPRASHLELEGLGHMGPMEAPERVNRLLRQFLEEHEPGALPLPSSPRLEFRTWRPDNASLGRHLWGDARVTSFITAEPFTPLQVEDRVRLEMAGLAKHGVQYGPVFLRATGELVGCCGFRPRASLPGVLELGFLFRPQFWGQGLATEAGRAAVEHAFGVLGVSALFAGHHPDNMGSGRVLQKLGFQRTHLELYPPTGREHPCYLLRREDFLSRGRLVGD